MGKNFVFYIRKVSCADCFKEILVKLEVLIDQTRQFLFFTSKGRILECCRFLGVWRIGFVIT
jgi:hypothetical protein